MENAPLPPESSANMPSSSAPARSAVSRRPPEPLASSDVVLASWHPLRTVDVVLAQPDRVAANVEQRRSLVGLAFVFFLCGAFFAIPYGCVLGVDSWWRVIALYLGSTLICLPSLYVFASYMGQRVSLSQVLVLALTIPAAAAVFTLGFAPILGFLRLTMAQEGGEITWRGISKVLLGIALAAGIVQLWRCLFGSHRGTSSLLFPLVMLVWHGVFLYVFIRMFRVLGL